MYFNIFNKMIIKTPNYTKNFLLLKKGGLRLFEQNKRNKNSSYNFPSQKLAISTYNNSKEKNQEEDNKNKEKNKNILKTYSTKSKAKYNLKIFPKLNEYKKLLFLKNIVSSEKNYLLEDYMKHKEINLMKNNNIKTIYDAKKTFFCDDKINDNRTSYYYQEELFDRNKKFPLMIKDIQSNYILLKNKKMKNYKDYYLLKKKEIEKNNFKDFNEKLGIRNIFIKSDKIMNKNKTFLNNNLNFLSFSNYFKTYSQMGGFNLKRQLTIK